MMEKILEKRSLQSWMKKLDSWTIYAPRKDGSERWNYGIAQNDSVGLNFTVTTLPAKALVFPQREVFLEFLKTVEESQETLKVNEVIPGKNPVVIFGVRPCDARAVSLLDRVFSGDFVDPYYWARRKQTVLVGLACDTPPWENCFCLSTEGSPHSEEGLDVLLTDLGDKYFVKTLTENGEKLVNLAKGLFKEPRLEDKKKAKAVHAEAEKKIVRRVKRAKKDLAAKLKGLFDSPLWDDESMSCIRCGICTYLCPSCHCFDINDEVDSVSPLRGKRVRTWDNCQFPDFTMHSSGHNPRPDKASRLRQRLFHKFQYFVEIYDKTMCTGCGRCISLCPVGIDIINVLDKVSDHGS
ncbi:MAG: 4Fe-4S dicluster domain-containing protein [Clostridiales bacterium]|nr:4Fe-4S dicluster domain-containing protein [Clostridiales bacterium]